MSPGREAAEKYFPVSGIDVVYRSRTLDPLFGDTGLPMLRLDR